MKITIIPATDTCPEIEVTSHGNVLWEDFINGSGVRMIRIVIVKPSVVHLEEDGTPT